MTFEEYNQNLRDCGVDTGWNFSEAGFITTTHCKLSRELTFEKFHQHFEAYVLRNSSAL